ncbi:ribose-5-phosphate isomerase RpiA [Paenibacillus sp. GD4]|uniref:ribose-5-phosphate isomerase RpiA n=1 Tax=Paenibacillus sp. GD4 TaxID=3068890 RepID=UPI002796B713|nr:ribose-5-phosphate isomerase RpiA [Paenibacillus sp. GD4]MDQ1910819.1 ribose-5-phosphate isomerase RpiA [Paenibacillus sp. GD4]
MDAKKIAGEQAAEFVKDGMTVGLGTGSTAYWAIMKVGQLVKDGLRIQAVCTSSNTEQLAAQLGIPIMDINEVDRVDLTIDGADEVDPQYQLIKGGGGALFREKLVASISSQFIVIVDESKCVSSLGRFPLPVEVAPFGWNITNKQLIQLGCQTQLRRAEQSPYITDNGNYIIDCRFGVISNPEELSIRLNGIPGVVENGLFVNMTDILIVGSQSGVVRTKMK